MAQIMEEDPDATSRLSDLATAAEMGLQLEYSKSPAFIGLLVADVMSADLPEFSAPQVQMLCEDDKVRALSHLRCAATVRRSGGVQLLASSALRLLRLPAIFWHPGRRTTSETA